MATLADMNVKIGADLQELLSKVDAAKAKLNQLTESEQQLKASINDLNSSLKQNETELTKTATELRKLVDSGKGATAEAKRLRAEMSGLAANSTKLTTNLNATKNQLAATTVQVKAQTVAMKQAGTASSGFAAGATKAFSALRTLANIIPGIGIGGLVGLIAGPLVDAFSDLLGITEDVNEATKDNSKSVEEMKTNYDRFVETLEQVTKALSQEQAKVSLLFNALTDSNVGLQNRKEIIDQLIKISPAYFDGLNAEKSSYEQIAKAVQDYNEGIAKTAEIKALLPEFETMFQKIVKLQVELNQLKRFQGGAFGLPEEEFEQQAKAIKDQIRGITNEIKVAKEALSGIAGGATPLEEILFGKQDKAEPKEKIKKVAKEHAKVYTETLQHAINELLKGGILPEDITKKSKAKIDVDVHLNLTPEDIQKLIDIDKLKEKLAPTLEVIEDFAKQTNEILSGGLSNAFSSLGENLGSAIANATSPIKGIFEGIFLSLGSLIQSLGEALINAAVKILIAKKTFFKALLANPALAIGIGVGLVALGALIKSQINKDVPGFASGGHVRGRGSGTSDSIPARLSAGEYIIKADTVRKFGVKFFDNLNQGSAPNFFNGIPKFAQGGFVSPSLQSIGGGQLIEVFGRIEARGDKLVTIIDRAKRQIGRNG